MNETEMMQCYQAIANGINSVQSTLTPAILAQLNGLQSQLAAAFSSGNSQNFRMVFQSLWGIALTQTKNVDLLRAIQPFLRSGLGLAGCAWGEIQLASVAITGLLASDILLFIALFILVAIIVIFLLWLLVTYVLPAIGRLLSWMPTQKPTPQQKANWGNLFGALNSPSFGPVYAIHNNCLPSEIKIG